MDSSRATPTTTTTTEEKGGAGRINNNNNNNDNDDNKEAGPARPYVSPSFSSNITIEVVGGELKAQWFQTADANYTNPSFVAIGYLGGGDKYNYTEVTLSGQDTKQAALNIINFDPKSQSCQFECRNSSCCNSARSLTSTTSPKIALSLPIPAGNAPSSECFCSPAITIIYWSFYPLTNYSGACNIPGGLSGQAWSYVDNMYHLDFCYNILTQVPAWVSIYPFPQVTIHFESWTPKAPVIPPIPSYCKFC
jgi:hypothetical protein